MRRLHGLAILAVCGAWVFAAQTPAWAEPGEHETDRRVTDGAEEVIARASGPAIEIEASGTSSQVTFDPSAITPVANPGGGSEPVVATPDFDPYPDPPEPPRLQCDFQNETGEFVGCPEATLQQEAPEEEDAEELDPVDVQTLIETAFQELPVAASPISYQPDGDWAAVNLDFIVYTDTNDQILTTEVLGVPLTFRVSPVHWTWDFGDGSPPVGSSTPGTPWPNHNVSHVYSSADEGVTITVATLWSGEYQINGTGAWYPVAGTITTANTAGPIEIVTFDVSLVPNHEDR